MRGKRQAPTSKRGIVLATAVTVTFCILAGAAASMDYPSQTAARPTETAQSSTITQPAPTSTEPPAVISTAEKAEEWEPDEAEVEYIAKTIFGEASVVPSRARRAAVAWCILNRVDSPSFPNTVEEVVTARYQFSGYRPDCDPPEEYRELARDVLRRWHREQQGETDVGRTLPSGWCFFTGDGRENNFTLEWQGTTLWNWTLPDPYEEVSECE